MYSATFIFRVKQEDENFERFNELVNRAAESNPGFIRRESWSNEAESKRAVVYYWRSLEALEDFSRHPDHLAAKQRYREWYSGYEVIVAEVVRRSSDGGLENPASP